MSRPKDRSPENSAGRKERLQGQRATEAREAWDEVNKHQKAEAAKTERLKELRLAKEANDRLVAEQTKAQKPKAAAKRR